MAVQVELKTGLGIFEVLSHVCRSPLDAFKQFVENAADAIEQAGEKEGCIRIEVKYGLASDRQQVVNSLIVEDNGIGMNAQKMQQILQHIGDSEKLNYALRGEKGIGILAFATITKELHISSTEKDGFAASCLILKRDLLKAGLGEVNRQCPLHSGSKRGTTAYLIDILPEVTAQLSKRRIKDYLSREFATDLRRNLYTLLIRDNEHYEYIEPQRYRGVKALAMDIPLGRFGHASAELYVLPVSAPDATVSLYGRGGTRVCYLVELEDFKKQPWIGQQLEGYIRCDYLKRTADKTAVIQNEVYRALVVELKALESYIGEQIQRVAQEYQSRRLAKVIRSTEEFINKFVSYIGGEVALEKLFPARRRVGEGVAVPKKPPSKPEEKPALAELAAQRPRAIPRPLFIQLCSPPVDKVQLRSWYDADTGLIHINREHADFLEAEQEDRRFMRYLFALWVKEHLLPEYQGDAERIADEMVGLLIKAELPFSRFLTR